MKILLVNAASPTYQGYYNKAYTTMPNGILYIAAVLEKAGHEVKIYDGFIDERKPEDFVEFGPQLIGFSVIGGPYMEGSMAQSAEFKKLLPDARIVWGNVSPSALPVQTLSENYVDFVVIGAGEYTMLELAQSLETGSPALADINGLGYKCNGQPMINEKRPFIKNLDQLPDPAWHLVDMKKYTEIGLTTSRGCAFQCSYCYHSSLSKGYASELSAERVVSQILHVQKEYGAKFVSFFNEDNFTFNKKRLRDFCRLMIERKIKVRWSCDSRADLNESDIALMARAGCTTMRLGLETGSQRMLDFLHKGISLETMERTFWLLVKRRIRVLIYIMYGFPTETPADFRQTHDLLKRLDYPPYLYSRFVPFPGSTLSDYCVAHGLITLPQKLAAWPEFLVAYGHRINLSLVPDAMIEEATASWRDSYAVQRFRFTLRHNPYYFLSAITNPKKFFYELWELIKFQIQLNGIYKIVKRKFSTGTNGVEPQLVPAASTISRR